MLSEVAPEYLISRGYTAEMIREERLSFKATGSFEAGPIKCHTITDSVIFPVRGLSGKLVALHTAGISIHDYRTFYDPARVFAACVYASGADFQILWDTGEVVIVEGVFDRVALKRAFPERAVMARLTKGISRPLTDLFTRLARRVFFCFDMDAPGARATEKAIKLLPGVHTVVLQISTKDPGQLYEKKGVRGVQSELTRQILINSIG